MLMKRAFPSTILGLLACCGSQASVAATSTTSFGVTVTVQASCQVFTTSSAPAVGPETAAVPVFNVRVMCTNSTPVQVALKGETENGTASAPREALASGPQRSGSLAPPRFGAIVSGSRSAIRKEAGCLSDGSGPSLSFHDQTWEESCVADGKLVERITVAY